tara:strand:- start:57 stop:206 length:150 start_codon:yes stop_codon:yes gene_type:complete
VDGDIDVIVQQRGLNLLGEERGAQVRTEGCVTDAISQGCDFDNRGFDIQ